MAVTSNTHIVGGSGQAGPYSYSFAILADADIRVSVNGIVKTVTTHYTLDSSNTRITFTSGNHPSTGDKVIVYRDTDEDPINSTFVSGSTIRSNELNDNFNQLLYIAQESDNQSLSKLGGVMEGDVGLGLKTKLYFEGDTDNAYETTLTVVDPTADRTITLPNVTGTVVTTGDTGTVTTQMIEDATIVNADIANTTITGGKLVNDTITATQIAADAITASELAPDAVTNVHIADGAVNATAMIANNVVTGPQIAASSIGASHIANDNVDSQHYATGSIDNEHIADNTIQNAKLKDNTIERDKIQGNAIGNAELDNNSVKTSNIENLNVTAGKLSADAVTTAKIQNLAVTNAKLENSAVTEAKLATQAVSADKLKDDAVTSAKIQNNAINSGDFIADNVVDSEHIQQGAIDNEHLANNSVTQLKIANNSVVSSHIISDQINASHIADDQIDSEHIAAGAVDAEHIATNAVTTAKIADAELTTLAGMQSGTASVLAGSTALAATLAEINTVCDGKGNQTTLTDSDAHYPTSGAVVDYVAAQIAPLGGLEVIADEDNFPAIPASGVVISISNCDGIVVNGSGVCTTARTAGNGSDNVTINNFPASLRSKTLTGELGLMVSSTGSSNTYNYHKLLAKEADVEQLSQDINDFGNRYRVGGSNPSSDNDDGDLFFNTGTGKMLVYNASNTAWEEVQSIGNFYINTIASYSGTGGNSATFNGSAYRFVLSNAPTNAQQLIVSINGVVQKPNAGTSQPSEGFAIDGSSILFSAAPASGSDYFIITCGSTVNIGTPSDNTVDTDIIQNLAVTTAKIADEAVTLAKLQHGDTNNNGKFLMLNNGADVSAPTYPQHVGSDTVRFHDITMMRDSSNVDPTIKPGDTNATITLECGSAASGAINSILKYDSLQLGRNTAYVKIVAPVDVAGQASYTLTLPHISGNNGQYLKTNGSGTTSWADIPAGVGGATGVDFNDGVKIHLGDSDELKIWHDSNTHSYITESGAGGLAIGGSLVSLMNLATTEHMFKGTENGSVELSYDGTKKFETTSYGTRVYGNLENHDDYIKVHDAGKLVAGNSDDLKIYHTGTSSYIDNSTGNLNLVSDATIWLGSKTGTETYIKGTKDNSVELYHNNVKRFETTSNGAGLLSNSAVFKLGGSAPVEMFHNGVNFHLRNTTGTVHIEAVSGENSIRCLQNAGVQLYYDNATKFETTAAGATVTGTLTTTSGVSVGSYLTGNTGSGGFLFYSDPTAARGAVLTTDDHFRPTHTNAQDLGTSSYRWRNVYTNDLQMSNEGSANEVDGTWGNYTIQEGEDDLFLINRRNGKKYKFNLTEVS